jgi:hypothetical protein
MIQLETTQNRVRQILADADGARYSDDLLVNAVRMALRGIDEKLPQVLARSFTVSTPGRDQVLTGLENCLYLVSLTLVNADGADAKKVELETSYTLQNGVSSLRFSGRRFPRVGEMLQIKYASPHTLAGLDGAEATSLPDGFAAALEFGSAGYACLLRAAVLSEAYGARQGESARLLEQSRLWLEQSSAALEAAKTWQEFGFPPGFALDAWDRKGG